MLRFAVFDLDGVLTESKSPMTPEMAQALLGLPERIWLGIISGGAFPQFMENVVPKLSSFPERFLLLPTNGARCFIYQDEYWKMIWDSPLSKEEVALIIKAFASALRDSGMEIPGIVYGNRIENRGTQVTFSAHGQDAPLPVKRFWDVDMAKRRKIVSFLLPLLPGFTISIGGTTSIDVSHVHKGDGVRKAMEYLGVQPSETAFMGDHLEPGGNDYEVLSTKVACFPVKNPEEALKLFPVLRNL